MKNDHINTRGNAVIKPRKYISYFCQRYCRDNHSKTYACDRKICNYVKWKWLTCISLQNYPCNLCVEELSVANNRNTHPSIYIEALSVAWSNLAIIRFRYLLSAYLDPRIYFSQQLSSPTTMNDWPDFWFAIYLSNNVSILFRV